MRESHGLPTDLGGVTGQETIPAPDLSDHFVESFMLHEERDGEQNRTKERDRGGRA